VRPQIFHFIVEEGSYHFQGFRVRVFSNCKNIGFNIQPYGIQSMLKEGHKHLSGLDEAVLKNIDACKQLSTVTRTSLGPNGNDRTYLFLFFFLCFFNSSPSGCCTSDSKSLDFYNVGMCTFSWLLI